MSLVSLLTSLFKFLCGSPSSQPEDTQLQTKPPQQQQYQQAHKPEQPQAAPQGAWQQPPPTDHHKHKPPTRPQFDANQANQHDPHYMALRADANKEGDQMGRCFSESRQAYESGDGARAKQLSNEGKAHQAKMKQLNEQAANWIFIENNKDSEPGEVDLHGLYVREAIERSDRAMEDAKRKGERELRLIVGKGLHSQGHAAKLKPAIEDLMQKHRLAAELDPRNAGVLIVQIGGSGGGVGPDEITRRLEREDEGCIVM